MEIWDLGFGIWAAAMPLGQVNFSELGAEEPTAGEESLAGVKALTAKLKLQTRRPSYLEWEARVRGQPWGRPTPRGAKGTSGQPRAEQDGSVCGFPGMEEALEWLRTELVSNAEGHGGMVPDPTREPLGLLLLQLGALLLHQHGHWLWGFARCCSSDLLSCPELWVVALYLSPLPAALCRQQQLHGCKLT